jgi:tRNA acetyltransferase TAN1
MLSLTDTGFKTVCGMSVVGSDWEEFKRFNLAELHRPPPEAGTDVKAETRPQSVTKDEAPAVPLSTDTDSLDP